MTSTLSRRVFLALWLSAACARAAEPLPALAASAENLTVSGLSSGGFMAVQFHVAHSALVRGAGVLAGGPYYCARGSAIRALSSCMSPHFFLPAPKPDVLREEVEKQAAAHRIDAPVNLAASRVWLFSGGRDPLVKSGVVDAAQAFYLQWLPESALAYERLPNAGHAMIAPRAKDARACEATAPPYLNRCGDFDAPGRLLAHLLGKLQPPAPAASGELLAFRQSEFTRPEAGMADAAWLYLPTGCRAGGCRIHIAFHGCRQHAGALGEAWARESGYNPWAESNRLIILYPRTSSAREPNGCWDWWGYTGADYHLQSAPQISAVRRMIERLAAKPAP
ncbi:MAG: PHB depolymerase family esterase [Azoarcus sp.]|jgi:poly(3-hydroxybutyrate) depolymerase|nr:PHB depolymerase family esterase [Azoarcus sp.]